MDTSRLDQFKKSLIQLRSTREVCELMVNFVADFVGGRGVGIYLWEEEEGAFTAWPRRSDGAQNKFMIFDKFVLYLTEHDRIYRAREFETSTASTAAPASGSPTADGHRFFEDIKAELVVPLVLNQSLVAIVYVRECAPLSDDRLTQLEEIRSLAVMALSNSILYARLEGILANLEEKVKERTRELENAQSQLVQSEKMAMLGVMVAGIAHEINTPAGVINGGVDNIEKNLNHLLNNAESLGSRLSAERRGALARVAARIGRSVAAGSYRRVRESFRRKKMLVEQLDAAGIPDSRDLATFLVENGLYAPQSGDGAEAARFMSSPFARKILGLFQSEDETERRELMKFLEEVANCSRNLRNIRTSIGAIVRIVRALKHYSHLDQGGQVVKADLHEGLEDTLIILGSIMKTEVNIERDFGQLPAVECNPDELGQVWTNLITNAYQAMKARTGGVIRISTALIKTEGLEAVEVRIRDNGPGIPPEIAGRIWDPFFTTKDQGEGSGLGLGIVKGIIEKHGGDISMKTAVGEGTEFRVLLPVKRR